MSQEGIGRQPEPAIPQTNIKKVARGYLERCRRLFYRGNFRLKERSLLFGLNYHEERPTSTQVVQLLDVLSTAYGVHAEHYFSEGVTDDGYNVVFIYVPLNFFSLRVRSVKNQTRRPPLVSR